MILYFVIDDCGNVIKITSDEWDAREDARFDSLSKYRSTKIVKVLGEYIAQYKYGACIDLILDDEE